MDTNFSLNYWLKRFPQQTLWVNYDPNMKKYIAMLTGVDSPFFVGYGYDAAAAINDLNAIVASKRIEEGKDANESN